MAASVLALTAVIGAAGCTSKATSGSATTRPSTTVASVVTLKATGSGTADISISSGGTSSSHLGVQLPYTTTVPIPTGSIKAISMNVKLVPGNTAAVVGCQIDIPGQVPITASGTTSGSGAQASASCSGSRQHSVKPG